MQFKANQSKVKKKLIIIPVFVTAFLFCSLLFLAWVGVQLAFVSSKNNYAGYIVLIASLAGVIWFLKVAVEHYKLVKLLSDSTVDFGIHSFVFTNPHGKMELQYDQISAIEFQQGSDMVQIYTTDRHLVDVPEGFKKFLPGKIFLHKKPLLILRDIYERNVSSMVNAVPGLTEKIKNYDDSPWLRL